LVENRGHDLREWIAAADFDIKSSFVGLFGQYLKGVTFACFPIAAPCPVCGVISDISGALLRLAA